MAQVMLDTADLDSWLENARRELPRVASNRIRRKTVEAATRFYTAQLRTRTPVFDTGNLRRSMTSVVRSYTRRGRRGQRGVSKYFLGVAGPSLTTGPHAHLVEFGTDDRYARRYRGAFTRRTMVDRSGVLRASRGFYRGRMPAQPFFEEIFRTAERGGRQVIEDTLRREIGREFERIARRQRAQGGE